MATTHTPKITIIGAGGFVFPFRLIGDLVSFPALRSATLHLMDLDAGRVARTASAARELVAHHGFDATVLETTDRREALEGADVVIITFQVGGVDSYRHDVEIPRRYGVDQTVGDTVGPGGVFRFLRSVNAYTAIAEDALELCPDAQFINYANPMAMATAFLNAKGLRTVGLCHSVQGTTRMLARTLGVDYDEVEYVCAGINHQAWILDFAQRGGEDLYPRLREVMGARHRRGVAAADLLGDDGDHSEAAAAASNYEGGNEQVRTAIMQSFGYFQTESSHHASEYLPYFRKDAETVLEYIPERWDYYEICMAHDEQGDVDQQLEKLKADLKPSVEYGASIVNAIVTGVPTVVYGNVPNTGLIGNLPDDACVEVPCLVDANGVQPTAIGQLPPQLAALNRTNVNVQTLAVRAALEGSVEHVHHAVALDPLTGALLTLDRIRSMTDELLEAHAALLPEALRPVTA